MKNNELSLTQIATNSPTAKAIFKDLENRERYRKVTDLRLLYYALAKDGCDPVEFVQTFRRLEKIGAGTLRRGTDNDPDRFMWNYNLKEIADAARKGSGLAGLTPLEEVKKRKLDNPIAKAEAEIERQEREERERAAAREKNQAEMSKKRVTAVVKNAPKEEQDQQAKMLEMISNMTPEQLEAMKLFMAATVKKAQ